MGPAPSNPFRFRRNGAAEAGCILYEVRCDPSLGTVQVTGGSSALDFLDTLAPPTDDWYRFTLEPTAPEGVVIVVCAPQGGCVHGRRGAPDVCAPPRLPPRST